MLLKYFHAPVTSCRRISTYLPDSSWRQPSSQAAFSLEIFPSMESVLYEGGLILDWERARTDNEEQALRRAQRRKKGSCYDFIAGLYTEGDDRQKFYYSFELRRRLQKAGFRGLQFGKVLYPWQGEEGDVRFSSERKLWDWFVRGTVTNAQPHQE